MTNCPDWYDDLDETLANAFEELANAVDDRDHGFRTFAFASIGLTGVPRSRIVVLRDVDVETKQVRLHTDLRSGKIREISANPHVSLLFYDKGRKLQVRLNGAAHQHLIGDDHGSLARSAFQESEPMSRICYRVEPGPGTVISEAGSYDHVDVSEAVDGDVDADPGAEHFAAVTVRGDDIEILYLASGGHRRSRFKRNEGGSFSGEWLTP